MMGLLPGYEKCFFCGPATGGLGLEIQYNDGTAFCDFTAREKFQGYDGMLHGGIVTGVLDEVMWWALFVETKMVFATWKLDAEFRRPVLCGKGYRASAQFLHHRHSTYYVSGVIEDGSGNVCARAKGAFRKTRQITLDDITKHLDFRGVPQEIRSFLYPPGTPD